MKVGMRLVLVGLVLVITVAMKVNAIVSVDNTSITLDAALKGKLLSTDVKGSGSYSGNCLKVQFKNLQDKKISLTIPAGTMFKPSDDGAQNILVPQDQIFVLAPKETKTTFVRGFCCEATDHAPAKDMDFTASVNKDPKMGKLFAFLKGKQFPDNLLQEAIWCISNNHEVTSICAPKMDAVKPLRDEVCKITGQVDTWYNTPKDHTVDAEGNISNETVRVSGLIKFKALTASKIHNEIHDENDVLLVKNPNEFTVKPGNVEYEFDIKVGGWKKGKYFVKVYEDSKVIHKQEFKI